MSKGVFRKMKEIIKRLIYLIINLSPTKGVVVLMYHSIGNNDLFFTVKTEEFEKQMRYLKENNFNVISLKELEENLEKGQIPSRTVVITFDDGYKDNLINAFPILERFNLPAAIFVSIGEMGKIKNLRGNELEILNEGDVKEIEKTKLISIEPHTVSHAKLAKLNANEVDYEIRESKKVFGSMLEKTCLYFAYPYGSYNDKVLAIVKNLGFKLAFTVRKGRIRISTNRLLLPRNSIDSQVSFEQFKNIVRFGRV